MNKCAQPDRIRGENDELQPIIGNRAAQDGVARKDFAKNALLHTLVT